MIDIEHRALGAFDQHRLAFVDCIVNQSSGVANEWLELQSFVEELIERRIRVQLFAIHRSQFTVLPLDVCANLFP